MTPNITLQVQYFMGCPHAEQALDLVRQYKERHKNTITKFIEVKDDLQARSTNFRGSPTILINGQDMAGIPVPAEPRMACRFYPDGLPSIQEFEKIVQKLTL